MVGDASSGLITWVIFAQLGFALLEQIGWSLTVPIMVELIAGRVRAQAASPSISASGLFGGTAPWVATYLVARTADCSPAWYMMAAAPAAPSRHAAHAGDGRPPACTVTTSRAWTQERNRLVQRV